MPARQDDGRAPSDGELGLYPRLLGARWDELGDAVQCLHRGVATTEAAGTFRIEHGKRWIVRSMLRRLGMPDEGETVPIRLRVQRADGRETWLRLWQDSRTTTTQSATSDGLLAEQFGLVEIDFKLEVISGRLSFVQTRAAIRIGRLRIPLPSWLSPRIAAHERTAGSAGRVDVSVSLAVPVIGPLISYAGTVEVAEPTS